MADLRIPRKTGASEPSGQIRVTDGSVDALKRFVDSEGDKTEVLTNQVSKAAAAAQKTVLAFLGDLKTRKAKTDDLNATNAALRAFSETQANYSKWSQEQLADPTFQNQAKMFDASKGELDRLYVEGLASVGDNEDARQKYETMFLKFSGDKRTEAGVHAAIAPGKAAEYVMSGLIEGLKSSITTAETPQSVISKISGFQNEVGLYTNSLGESRVKALQQEATAAGVTTALVKQSMNDPYVAEEQLKTYRQILKSKGMEGILSAEKVENLTKHINSQKHAFDIGVQDSQHRVNTDIVAKAYNIANNEDDKKYGDTQKRLGTLIYERGALSEKFDNQTPDDYKRNKNAILKETIKEYDGIINFMQNKIKAKIKEGEDGTPEQDNNALNLLRSIQRGIPMSIQELVEAQKKGKITLKDEVALEQKLRDREMNTSPEDKAALKDFMTRVDAVAEETWPSSNKSNKSKREQFKDSAVLAYAGDKNVKLYELLSTFKTSVSKNTDPEWYAKTKERVGITPDPTKAQVQQAALVIAEQLQKGSEKLAKIDKVKLEGFVSEAIKLTDEQIKKNPKWATKRNGMIKHYANEIATKAGY